jgi:hypothetical protein
LISPFPTRPTSTLHYSPSLSLPPSSPYILAFATTPSSSKATLFLDLFDLHHNKCIPLSCRAIIYPFPFSLCACSVPKGNLLCCCGVPEKSCWSSPLQRKGTFRDRMYQKQKSAPAIFGYTTDPLPTKKRALAGCSAPPKCFDLTTRYL